MHIRHENCSRAVDVTLAPSNVHQAFVSGVDGISSYLPLVWDACSKEPALWLSLSFVTQVKKRERAEAEVLRHARAAQALQQKVKRLKKQVQQYSQAGAGTPPLPHEDSEGDEDSAYGLTGRVPASFQSCYCTCHAAMACAV
jgi:hypothetical protein